MKVYTTKRPIAQVSCATNKVLAVYTSQSDVMRKTGITGIGRVLDNQYQRGGYRWCSITVEQYFELKKKLQQVYYQRCLRCDEVYISYRNLYEAGTEDFVPHIHIELLDCCKECQ